MSFDFRYVAIGTDGERVRGSMPGSDEHEVFRLLASKGLRPIKVTQRYRFFSVQARSKRISRTMISAMTRELSVLVDARIPIEQGLAAMAANERNQALAAMIGDIASRIESGDKVSDAIAAHVDVLGEVYVATMRAAEASGQLAEVTELLADMLESEVAMQQQLKRAAAYPVIVLSVVGIALGVILGFVVPSFAKTFESSGIDLPLATRIVQAVGASVKTWWWLYLGTGIGTAVVVVQMWGTPRGRLWLEGVLARTPYISKLLNAISTARLCRVLSIASGAGLGLTEAIEVSASASGSARVKQESLETTAKLRGGASLNEVMAESETLPPFARRLLAASKDNAEVARSSRIIARHFDREAKHLSGSISSIIEPVMTIVLAVIVLVVALSVFLPMWKLIGVH
jgi:MSHA biogenesis protein MshG